MQRRNVASNFERVGIIEPERDSAGGIIEMRPQTNQPLHKYGEGPFCRFRIGQGTNWQRSGVYVLTLNGVAHYVGQCKNLAMIWHSVGNITPTSIAPNGRQTHCRLNTLILNESKQGAELVLWFQAVEDGGERSALKAELIGSRNPGLELVAEHLAGTVLGWMNYFGRVTYKYSSFSPRPYSVPHSGQGVCGPPRERNKRVGSGALHSMHNRSPTAPKAWS